MVPVGARRPQYARRRGVCTPARRLAPPAPCGLQQAPGRECRRGLPMTRQGGGPWKDGRTIGLSGVDDRALPTRRGGSGAWGLAHALPHRVVCPLKWGPGPGVGTGAWGLGVAFARACCIGDGRGAANRSILVHGVLAWLLPGHVALEMAEARRTGGILVHGVLPHALPHLTVGSM
jgi:hypothetical protein